MLEQWRQRARTLKRETYALYLACRDRRTPWYAKTLALCVVAYALSPIDLIPDFIPVVGLLDELVLLPLGIALVIRLIPQPVMAECRGRAAEDFDAPTALLRFGAAMIIIVWIVLATWTAWIVGGLL